MSILDTVNSIRTSDGVRVIIAGTEKMGKTTLAASAPNPLLIPMEVGYSNLTIPKTRMLSDYQEVMILFQEIIEAAKQGNFPYKSIVIDSGTALERFIHDYVVKLDKNYSPGKGITMESSHGGYGKAYSVANDIFHNFLQICDQLAVHGKINIIITCHVFASKVIDPIAGEYDFWDLQLHSPKNFKQFGKREMITQWADIIGFLYEPLFISEGESITKAINMNKGRVLGLSRTPSYIAGNRFGVEGEISIPKVNGWDVLSQYIENETKTNIFN